MKFEEFFFYQEVESELICGITKHLLVNFVIWYGFEIAG